jgi:acyl-coenzyme A synthetase/AMP-(fatty) acid ligase
MFINHIYRHAHEDPDRLAVINNGHEITYARFACAIEATRNHLIQAGLPDHGVIVRLDRDLYMDWLILLAVRSLGLTTVSGPSWQAIERLGLNDITGVVCLSAEASALADVRTAHPDLVVVSLPLTVMQPTDAQDLPSPLPDGSFGDHIIYTSGTTGTNKRILRDGSAIEAAMIDHDAGVIEQFLSKSGFFHCHGFETWSGPGYWDPTVCWYKSLIRN